MTTENPPFGTTYLANVGKPVKTVEHAQLKQAFPFVVWRSNCPECSYGFLSCRRKRNVNEQFLCLDDIDTCDTCAQTFQYSDIDRMRRIDKGDLPVSEWPARYKGK